MENMDQNNNVGRHCKMVKILWGVEKRICPRKKPAWAKMSKNAFDNQDVWLGILAIARLMPPRDNTAISISE